FYLFGMMGLVILNEALEDEPTQAQPRVAKSKPRARVAHTAIETPAHKRAA
ncbi:MAG: hypothetical protein HY444_09670, partial [Nitrospirae bacterium]|nr:hypothetical protein [Nitrospirota bacterium]